ncbi:hypothetical protein Rhal01_03009 [Rubritalea halochordaticola]|uniref:Peptidase S54 rhomboid domain-containing protein n=2 Tax=Rubritalea halochordaticola TaxID=714537 RepID=A0ABP9V2B4_9BACT
MDQILNSFERKFGNWAIPGLIRYLAIIFFGTFLMGAAKPEIVMALDFDFEKIKAGEYWRLFSFILAPKAVAMGPFSAIWAFFGMMLLFIFSDSLEYQWGVFRTNLFVLWGFLSTLAANLIMALVFESSPPMSGIYLGASILFAFATYNPRFTLMLFFVIPCPIWIIAAFTGLIMGLSCLSSAEIAVFTIVALSNYLIVAIPMRFMQARGERSSFKRRRKFKSMAYSRERTPFHSCSACGANDVTHPEKEFRVSQDGNDYCLEHLPK